MSIMDFIEFKNKSVAELQELLVKVRSELHRNRLKAMGRELKQVHLISEARRTIARIQTLLRNKSADSKKGLK